MSKTDIDLKFKAEGRCRLCLRSSRVRPLTRHRIVPGSMRGRYVPNNCVPLCRLCHDLVDNRSDPDQNLTYRRMLRASLWPVEVAHAAGAMRGRFDVGYPRPTRELVLERRQQTAA